MNRIEVSQITKKFRIYHDKSSTLKDIVLSFGKRRSYDTVEVINDVTFNIEDGIVYGLIGRNGSGKSTLLKLLSRIIYPDSGSIDIEGRVSSLLELGAGFHPDMSGRENIYSNASIFGLSRKEIDEKLQDIIQFSELGEYIDNPIRTYSSGMYMRLAFSIAINVNADIILIDEILAVGDANFQTKCFKKLRELKANKKTIVIVSHDLGSIQSLCDKAMWIDEGRIRKQGNVNDVVEAYKGFMGHIKYDSDERKTEEEGTEKEVLIVEEIAVDSDNRWGNRDMVVKEVAIYNSSNEKSKVIYSGDSVYIKVDYETLNYSIEEFVIGFGLFTLRGECVFGTNTEIDNVTVKDPLSKGSVVIEISDLNLIQGDYVLDVALVDINLDAYDFYKKCYEFSVISQINDVGIVRLQHKWIKDGNML